MLGNRGGMNLYAYVNNNVYFLNDYLGNSLSPYSGYLEEKMDQTTNQRGLLALTYGAFPEVVPQKSTKFVNGANKYCITLPNITFQPRIEYYSTLDDKGTRTAIEGGPDFKPSGSSRTVREHEMEHVNNAAMYWNDFVSESNAYEGCYCLRSCQEIAYELVITMYELYGSKSIYYNKSFDLAEYGLQMDAITLSQLENEKQEARSIIIKASQEVEFKKIVMDRCNKESL